MIWKSLLMILIGFSSGLIIAGGVFAFIAIIGVVPRLAQKTRTIKYIYIYEDSITIGGIFGVSTMLWDYHLPIGSITIVLFSIAIGIFVGCIAVSLAEVLDVIPILSRRLSLKTGMAFFVLSVALGKMIGAIVYYTVPGFFKSLG